MGTKSARSHSIRSIACRSVRWATSVWTLERSRDDNDRGGFIHAHRHGGCITTILMETGYCLETPFCQGRPAECIRGQIFAYQSSLEGGELG